MLRITEYHKDVDDGKFEFPKGFDNGLRLKDFLEDEVDEKFYISQEKTEKLISQLKDNPWLNKNKNYVPSDGLTGYPMHSQDFVRTGFQDLSYTLSARDYKDPKIVCIGNVNPSGRGMNGNVHAGDIAPTLTTNKGEGPKMCMPCLTPDREEKRQNGRRFKEDGEPMFTLTGQDRHGVLQIGNIVDTGNWDNPQAGRIYSPEGLSPTLNTCGGGQREPKILRPERTEYGKAIRKQYEAGEVEESRHNMTELRPREDGISNTLTTVQKDNLLLEPQYRIRKLTPRECWRLMGFTDEEFQKAADAGVSNSQLYKQAGNSIVVDVLEYIFGNLLK